MRIYMSRVFIVQEPLKRDHETGQLVPIMDFTRAREYGELIICLRSGPVALAANHTINQLKEVLKDFSDNDYLLFAGDPSAIALASAVASEINNGFFQMLKWDKASKSYIKVAAQIKTRRSECQN